MDPDFWSFSDKTRGLSLRLNAATSFCRSSFSRGHGYQIQEGLVQLQLVKNFGSDILPSTQFHP